MLFFRLKKIAVCLIVLICLFHVGLAAQEARLDDIIVTNTRDDLLIFLNVEGAFTEKMQTAVTSGVPITFSFYLHLYTTRNFWFDKKLTDLKITHVLKYNSLKKEYTVAGSWGNPEPTVLDSFEAAQKLMCKLDSIVLIKLNELTKGEQYQIRAKAELNKKTLPLNLHHILFFVSLWDFQTDWYTIDFIY